VSEQSVWKRVVAVERTFIESVHLVGDAGEETVLVKVRPVRRAEHRCSLRSPSRAV
jgi:hypothetical protein